MIVESTQILFAVRPSLMLLHVPLPFKDKYATFFHAAPLPNNNNNARPERKRAPIHRYAVVEHRIHCETQFFWEHASIRSPQNLRQKHKKIYACLRKNIVFCRGFSSAGI